MTEAFHTPDPAIIGLLRAHAATSTAEPVRAALTHALHEIQRASEELNAGQRPFLTVVMRTQARKLEAMQDALLTLFGQSNQDFELLILPHNVTEEDVAEVQRLVALQAPSFRERIRVIPVLGGGRSRPLNTAVHEGRGCYFAFFDDDDLVFGHWVESFARAAEAAPGQLLRAVAATQHMRFENWAAGAKGFRSTTWPQAEYPVSFKIEEHIERNHTPFMAVAFPRELFAVWGETFDEELDVCEDWDMILRGAFLLGVTSVTELTTVYRMWQGVTSSYSEHDVQAWRASEKRVTDKLNATPVLLNSGGPASLVESLKEKVVYQQDDTRIHELTHSTSWRVTAPLRGATRLARAVVRRARRS